MPRQPLRSNDLLKEREALEQLLASDGWRVFVRHISREWYGEGYYARMAAVLGGDSLVDAKAIHLTSLQMKAALDWPKQRVIELDGVVEES